MSYHDNRIQYPDKCISTPKPCMDSDGYKCLHFRLFRYQKIINDIVSEKICFDFLILFVVDYATVNYISQTKCACSIFWKFCEIKNDENLANSGKTFLDRQTR